MWSALAESQGCFLRDKYATGGSGSCQVMDACLAPGLSVRPFNDVTGAFELHPPNTSEPVISNVRVLGKQGAHEVARQVAGWDACLMQIVEPLGLGGKLLRERNEWCDFTHLGQCSFAGVYQPQVPEPDTDFGHFFLIGGYVKAWKLLGLEPSASLSDLRAAGKEMCALNTTQLQARFDLGKFGVAKWEEVKEACFLGAFSFALLYHGHSFDERRTFTAVETMQYQNPPQSPTTLKVGWQLGAILYEINTLPWTYKRQTECESVSPLASPMISLRIGFLGCLISFAAGIFITRKKPEKSRRSSGLDSKSLKVADFELTSDFGPCKQSRGQDAGFRFKISQVQNTFEAPMALHARAKQVPRCCVAP
eukprot:CAMPEP_0172594030 /NCGR_PEP_ID=MMETSP1068-20121228/13289_1 /TAXON_ID=35684 /ORGANISM="Pseudopedinella elastica, Strain CCMP716" /LENGTH=364 /DNA_ID=CAMNT_0013391801 /DNA_START=1082 /DNA_END=2172 /DNA_ORIENTATION=+